jgi:hypothetical protein
MLRTVEVGSRELIVSGSFASLPLFVTMEEETNAIPTMGSSLVQGACCAEFIPSYELGPGRRQKRKSPGTNAMGG